MSEEIIKQLEELVEVLAEEVSGKEEMTLENATRFIELEKIKKEVKTLEESYEEEKKHNNIPARYEKFIENKVNGEEDKISHDELIEIFNNILDSYRYYNISLDINIKLFKDGKEIDFSKDRQSIRNCKVFKDYIGEKLSDIEFKLEVFENIPKNKIYIVMQDFIKELEEYNSSKRFKKSNAKKLQNTSYKLIQKDIKIIEAYQKMIFDYSSDNDYNNDPKFTILNPTLDDVYQLNKELIEELKTKEFEILDVYRYGGTNLYNSTKKRLKYFFKEVGKAWKVNTHYAKEMIDIL